MITIIVKAEPNAHKSIQDWRNGHPNGFFVNVISKSNIMLHRTNCSQHFGTTDWPEGTPNWGTLATTTKICGTDRKQLIQWVEDYYGHEIKICKDCNP